jgi:hypothetical protein
MNVVETCFSESSLEATTKHSQPQNTREPEFVNVYGAQESPLWSVSGMMNAVWVYKKPCLVECRANLTYTYTLVNTN